MLAYLNKRLRNDLKRITLDGFACFIHVIHGMRATVWFCPNATEYGAFADKNIVFLSFVRKLTVTQGGYDVINAA